VISYAGARTTYLVRLADGATKSVDVTATPGITSFDGLVYVSNAELWAKVGGTLRRYALGAW
jgi:hypothetical protein